MSRQTVVPTTHEKVMREDDFLVSRTDMRGRIVYGNRIFIEFSGYSESELLGAQHNIVRHPDMPRGVFKLLWDTIAIQHEIFAYVKNMSMDGSFYWVYANVTPSLDMQGQVEGFFLCVANPGHRRYGSWKTFIGRCWKSSAKPAPRMHQTHQSHG
jgi:PAS domain S-box-containing protein